MVRRLQLRRPRRRQPDPRWSTARRERQQHPRLLRQCGPCCPGDTKNDQSVDGIGLATILTRWGLPGAKFPAADCNGDGLIDGTDLAIVLGGWGGCV
jgi:hypothetical protein